jgi:hypothetical protein
MRLVSVSIACAALLIAGPAVAGERVAPGVHKDWHDVDEVEIVKAFALSSYDRLLVMPFDKSEVKLPAEKEKTYEPTREAVAASDIHFFSEFRKKLQEKRAAFVVEQGTAGTAAGSATATAAAAAPAGDAVAGGRQLVLRGKLVKLNAGSKAARAFVGFGAGAAGAKYALELVDAATDEVLVRFTHEKRAGTGMFGGNYVDVMTRSVKEVASDLAKALSEF